MLFSLVFCKVFDAVYHDLLLMKIRAYGFSIVFLNWISDCLPERQQFVNMGSARSKVVSTFKCVIKRSVLGLLLLLIFLSDLPDVLRTAVAMLYAHDQTLS